MSFIFISHANSDKPKIKHILDALIAHEVKVWIDDPAAPALGYNAQQIKAHFYRIRAGGRWQDEIEDALRAADVVLVCLSEHFKEADRYIFHEEATIARYERKLICCQIDEVDLKTLPGNFDAQQIVDVRAQLPGPAVNASQLIRHPRPRSELETRLEGLIEDLKNKMRRVRLERAKQSGPRDPFTPFLVDRKDQ